MMPNPDLERLVNIVIDDLTTIHGWATLAFRDPQNLYVQEQALEIIESTARQAARRLQTYMSGRGAEGEPVR